MVICKQQKSSLFSEENGIEINRFGKTSVSTTKRDDTIYGMKYVSKKGIFLNLMKWKAPLKIPNTH